LSVIGRVDDHAVADLRAALDGIRHALDADTPHLGAQVVLTIHADVERAHEAAFGGLVVLHDAASGAHFDRGGRAVRRAGQKVAVHVEVCAAVEDDAVRAVAVEVTEQRAIGVADGACNP
jgi:hypothetical protein